MRALALLLALVPAVAGADTLVAARTVRSLAVLGPDDLALVPGDIPGTLSSPADAVGMEARVVLYAGRPIREGDVGAAAVVERNQLVTIAYDSGTLRIATDGRALARGGVGDAIRVMNIASKTTITGTIGADGAVHVPGSASLR